MEKDKQLQAFCQSGYRVLRICLLWLIQFRIGIPESNVELLNSMFNTNSRAYECAKICLMAKQMPYFLHFPTV